ncbi:arabinofuranosidase catalytic domain-containing protein [Terracidiphilus gabretensis]|uniref:arabinofuranosidase catalytic domain-containing protein n=1 Tax=Terracidiphilus gabretensis TaxID=1577687 RepID=UPI00071B72EF|nr:arabinofuranosidase catalytic domain-containing protein [Terracidiphilus gabretensis]
MLVRDKSQSLYRRISFTASVIALLVTGLIDVRPAQASNGPCDIYAAASTACVAAFSTTRALYSSYTGSLYQVTRESDNTTTNIGVLSDGYANAATQDTFCAGTVCTITEIYDQSSNHNNLTVAPPGGETSGPGPGGYDLPAFATALPITAGGHKVYGVYFQSGMGYRNDATTGIAVNGQPEGVYMVTSGTHLNGGCCFDFGNAETSNDDDGAGRMDAINIICTTNPCTPIAGLDMENGIYGQLAVAGGTPFVTAMGSNDGQHYYAIYQGNAQSGSLTTTGSTALPSGYSPMRQEGAIILGIGGDNSQSTIGSFFEGVMTAGAPTSTTMNSVQANIVSVGYAGMLPYHDGFGSGSASGWTTYDGSWSVSSSGAYVNSTADNNGDKAVTGSPTWDNYTLQGDVEITSSGDAGLNFRVTNPASGLDSLDGYYVGVDAVSGDLVLGRESYGWTALQTTAMPGGVSTNAWYHLTVQAVGCTFTVSAQAVGSTTSTGFSYTDSGCTFTAGAIGVRSHLASAMWRNICVSVGGTSTLPYYAPFAAGTGPSGWTTYAGTWSLSSENYIDSASETSGDKSIGGPTSGNFTLTGDVDVTSSSGNAGFLVRATNPAVGADSVDAYYLGVDTGGFIEIGKESYGWTQLAAAPLNASPANTWIHLTAQVVGCQIRLTAQPVDSSTPANDVSVTDCSFSSGQVGVRAYDTTAQWRFVSVIPN